MSGDSCEHRSQHVPRFARRPRCTDCGIDVPMEGDAEVARLAELSGFQTDVARVAFDHCGGNIADARSLLNGIANTVPLLQETDD